MALIIYNMNKLHYKLQQLPASMSSSSSSVDSKAQLDNNSTSSSSSSRSSDAYQKQFDPTSKRQCKTKEDLYFIICQ
jgi:hypothetical protein